MTTEPGTTSSPVALITGGAGGIGYATAAELARGAARIALLSLPGPDLDEAAESLTREGGTVLAVGADVRDAGQVDQAVGHVVEAFGTIDVLVASAGLADQSRIADGSPQKWRNVVDTNLLGVAHSIRAVAPVMERNGSGDIVIIASVSGRDTYIGEPLYIASKWGTVGLGHAVRQELQPKNIRVSLIEPGLVDTPLTRNSDAVRPLLELGGAMEAEDVAGAVAWLLSRPRRLSISEMVLRPTSLGDLESI